MNNIEAYKFTQEHPDVAAAGQAQMQAVLARSATDADFRARLIAQPRETLEEFTGQPIPASVNLVFVENSADATIVLPAPIDPAAELSEAELEAVAGGTDVVVTGLLIAGVAAAAGAITAGILIGRSQ